MNSSSPALEYRPGTMADVPQLCELLALLFDQESDFLPDARRQIRGLEMIMSQPEIGRIFCAVEGGIVFGMVSILFTISTAEGGRAAWLEDMIVHPARRRGGIGGRLLQTAIAGAKESGCTRITLLTDDTNAAAQEFYRRAGFVRSPMIPLRLHI